MKFPSQTVQTPTAEIELLVQQRTLKFKINLFSLLALPIWRLLETGSKKSFMKNVCFVYKWPLAWNREWSLCFIWYFEKITLSVQSKLTCTCSKWTIEALEKVLKYVQICSSVFIVNFEYWLRTSNFFL